MILGFIFTVLLGVVKDSSCLPGFRRRTFYVNPPENREYFISYSRQSNWLYIFLNRFLTVLSILLGIILVTLFILFLLHPNWLQSVTLYFYRTFGSMPEYPGTLLFPSDRTCYNLLDKYNPHCIINSTHASYYELDKQPVSAYLCRKLTNSTTDKFPDGIFDDIVDIATNTTGTEESVRESVIFYMGKYLTDKLEETHTVNIDSTEVQIKFKEIAANWMAEVVNREIEGTETIRDILRKIPQETNQ